MPTRFEVGDLIRAKSATRYGVTNSKRMVRVVEVGGEEIDVRLLRPVKGWAMGTYRVNSSDFRLVRRGK